MTQILDADLVDLVLDNVPDQIMEGANDILKGDDRQRRAVADYAELIVMVLRATVDEPMPEELEDALLYHGFIED